ncbi:glycosyltransferase family 4 protein [Paenibacillus glycanilyticus]|uniref:Spore coat protein SA n=1 Tax=Paenibacillus glycanilyticus TaxID=126569 RepID=A0ABQ6ND37_9BACL|nr:glycosyltransferase family 4 protein [Paenibacillus glycanilyticus]GMK42881.1 spore coat protein SA [Paenibacillus glycanilyticus]
MKILMIAPEQLPVPGNGSVEICMLAIAKQLAVSHKVTIVSRQSSGLPNVSNHGNLTIVRVPSGSSQKYIASVLRYIRGKYYDIIQVDNRPHYMAKVKHAFPLTPVSLFLHSLTFVPRTKAVATSLDKADLIIANSVSLKSNLSRLFPTQSSKIRTVYLGVDTIRFKPNDSKKKSDTFQVLFAGRIIPRKGVPVIIQAIGIMKRKYPKVRLIIVGGGKANYINSLRLLARKNRINARFTGMIPHNRVHQLYKNADCFVCPSQRHEAFGLVNVEAMASGLPVVASSIGGIKEIVRHGANGYLVKQYKNPRSHAEWIGKLAGDKNLASKLGKQARKDAVERFSWSKMAYKLMTLYKHASSNLKEKKTS